MPSKSKKKKKSKVILHTTKSLRKEITYVRSKTLADIKQMRLLWARGYSDIDIRQELGLDFQNWKRRIRIMREIPADEDVISIARRYLHNHEKAISRLEQRMKNLEEIRTKAAEEIEIFDRKEIDKKTKRPKLLYKRPRDMHLAASVTRDLATLDREILRAHQEMITMKQRLGLVETYLPQMDNPDAAFEDAVVVTSANLMRVWARRKERELLERKKDMSNNGAAEKEDVAILIPPTRPNGVSSE